MDQLEQSGGGKTKGLGNRSNVAATTWKQAPKAPGAYDSQTSATPPPNTIWDLKVKYWYYDGVSGAPRYEKKQ